MQMQRLFVPRRQALDRYTSRLPLHAFSTILLALRISCTPRRSTCSPVISGLYFRRVHTYVIRDCICLSPCSYAAAR